MKNHPLTGDKRGDTAMREAISAVSISCFLYVVYTYSAPIFWALETLGFLGLWIAVSALVIAPFTAVFWGYLRVIEWQKNNDHRRDIEWQKTQIDELKIVTEAQKKTPLLAGGERPKLSTNSPILLADNQQKKPLLLDDFPIEDAIIVGSKGAGKSNLLKYIIADLQRRDKKITIVDPHAPSKIVGINCIGAGMNFDEIESFFLSEVAAVTRQYRDGKTSDDAEISHVIIMDELLKIRLTIDETIYNSFMASAYIDFRKAGKGVISAVQSERDLLTGRMDIFNGIDKIEITKDPKTKERICFTGTFDTPKKERAEKELPPKFQGVPIAKTIVIPEQEPYTDMKRAVLMEVIKAGASAKVSGREYIRRSGYVKNSTSSEFVSRMVGTLSQKPPTAE